MTIDTNDLLNSILASLSRIDYIKSQDLPGIDLYMDQVTTFMDEHLSSTKRHQEDKILTKTMINNYTKNNLLPSPNKKRYSNEHLLTLIFIYYFKNILSISDIQAVLNPITDKYFGSDSDFDLASVYEEVFRLEASEVEDLKTEIVEKYRISHETFQDAPAEDKDSLQTFAFICMLSFDVYVKKLLIEKMIDGMNPPSPAKDKKEEKHKKS